VTNDHRTIIAKIAKSAKIAKIGRPSMTEGGATREGERRSVGACSSELVTSFNFGNFGSLGNFGNAHASGLRLSHFEDTASSTVL
jgi:hypothetical protein